MKFSDYSSSGSPDLLWREADTTKLKVASRNFANAPKSACDFHVGIGDSSVGIATSLRKERQRKRDLFPGMGKRFHLRQSAQTSWETRLVSYSKDTINPLSDKHSGEGINLTTILYLLQRLRISGNVPPPQYIPFMACIEKCLHFRYLLPEFHFSCAVCTKFIWKVFGWKSAMCWFCYK